MCGIIDPTQEAMMEAVRAAFRHASANEPEKALAAIEPLLVDETFADVRGTVLNYRAIVLLRFERFDEARADLLAAHGLSQPGTYHRFALELGLIEDAERRGDRIDELAWCRRAVETAANDPRSSGVGVVQRLLGLVASLSPEDREQCERIIRISWTLFELDGEPDCSDLAVVLPRLLAAYTERAGRRS
jgi:hypothetical protein